MSNVVNFNTQVYGRRATEEVVDRSFKEFGQRNVLSGKTVEQFFQDYEDLFFQIPASGSVNSHQYLIEKSSELFRVEQVMEDIQPLLDEITLLRSQSVQDQQTIIDLNLKIAELSSAASNQVYS